MHRISILFNRVTYKPQMTLFRSLIRDGFADDVKHVISPDVVITRYGRTWRLSQLNNEQYRHRLDEMEDINVKPFAMKVTGPILR